MKITQVILFSLFAFASSNPAPDAEHALEARQTYGSCRVTGNRDRLDGPGVCRRIKYGGCTGVSVPGFCPGLPNDIQCCRTIACEAPYQDLRFNYCRNTYKGCGGTNIDGKCPGGNDIKCCAN